MRAGTRHETGLIQTPNNGSGAGFLRNLFRGRISKRSAASLVFFVAISVFLAATIDTSARANSIESDFFNYLREYTYAKNEDFSEFIARTQWEILYLTLTWVFAKTGASFESFIVVSSIFLSFSYFLVCEKITRSPSWTIFATLLFSLSPLFESLTQVIVRQGLSLSFLMVSMSFFIDRRYAWAFFFAAASALTHSISLVLVCVLAFSIIFKERWRLATWLALMVLMLYPFNLPANTLGFVAGQFSAILFDGYTYNVWRYSTGFKLAFGAASLITLAPAIVFLALRRELDNEKWMIVFASILTITYIVAANLPFHDRIASVSWIFAPILIVSVFSTRRFSKPVPR